MTGRTVLGVWAHPDDEAYLSAGLMHRFVRNGDRVVVITATLGEHGTADALLWPPQRLASRRHHELRTSLATLGVHELHVLGFEDGQCELHDATDLVRGYVDDIDPDLIVTFGPDGMTGHCDHRAVSRWTTQAWELGGSTCDLWYATVTPEFHTQWGAINERIGLWESGHEPPCTHLDDVCHSVLLDEHELDVKMSALRAHATQTTALSELIGRDTYRYWWSTETFRAAVKAAAPDRRRQPIEVGTR